MSNTTRADLFSAQDRMQPSLPPCDPAFTIRRAKTRRRFVETADPHFNVGWVEVEQARAAGWAKASSAERADGSGHFGIVAPPLRRMNRSDR